jgi:hypothetical protein
MHSRNNETNNCRKGRSGLQKKIRGVIIMIVRGNLKLRHRALSKKEILWCQLTRNIICTSITKSMVNYTIISKKWFTGYAICGPKSQIFIRVVADSRYTAKYTKTLCMYWFYLLIDILVAPLQIYEIPHVENLKKEKEGPRSEISTKGE